MADLTKETQHILIEGIFAKKVCVMAGKLTENQRIFDDFQQFPAIFLVFQRYSVC